MESLGWVMQLPRWPHNMPKIVAPGYGCAPVSPPFACISAHPWGEGLRPVVMFTVCGALGSIGNTVMHLGCMTQSLGSIECIVQGTYCLAKCGQLVEEEEEEQEFA